MLAIRSSSFMCQNPTTSCAICKLHTYIRRIYTQNTDNKQKFDLMNIKNLRFKLHLLFFHWFFLNLCFVCFISRLKWIGRLKFRKQWNWIVGCTDADRKFEWISRLDCLYWILIFHLKLNQGELYDKLRSTYNQKGNLLFMMVVNVC